MNILGRVVESVGEGVRDMKEGDHVIPLFNGECGECVFCKRDGTNMCRDYGVNPMKKVMMGDGKSRFWTKGARQPIFHFLNTSTFSEFTVVESSCVVKVDPKFPLEKMTLLSCGVSTGRSLPLCLSIHLESFEPLMQVRACSGMRIPIQISPWDVSVLVLERILRVVL